MSTTWLSSLRIASVLTRPRIAVTIGSAIAVTVPKANSRMITAAASPIASLLSVLVCDSASPR